MSEVQIYYTDRKRDFEEDFNDVKISLNPGKCDWWDFDGDKLVSLHDYESLLTQIKECEEKLSVAVQALEYSMFAETKGFDIGLIREALQKLKEE